MSVNPPPFKNQESGMSLFLILWAALFFGSVMYLPIGFSIIKNSALEHRMIDLSNLQGVLTLSISIVLGVLSFVIPSFLLNSQKRDLQKSSKTPEFQELKSRFFAPFIIRIALSDSIAVLGFMNAVMSHDYYRMVPNLALSTFCFLMAFPSEAKIKDAFGILN